MNTWTDEHIELYLTEHIRAHLADNIDEALVSAALPSIAELDAKSSSTQFGAIFVRFMEITTQPRKGGSQDTSLTFGILVMARNHHGEFGTLWFMAEIRKAMYELTYNNIAFEFTGETAGIKGERKGMNQSILSFKINLPYPQAYK